MSTSNVAPPSSPLARAIERIITEHRKRSEELVRRIREAERAPPRRLRTWSETRREILGLPR